MAVALAMCDCQAETSACAQRTLGENDLPLIDPQSVCSDKGKKLWCDHLR